MRSSAAAPALIRSAPSHRSVGRLVRWHTANRTLRSSTSSVAEAGRSSVPLESRLITGSFCQSGRVISPLARDCRPRAPAQSIHNYVARPSAPGWPQLWCQEAEASPTLSWMPSRDAAACARAPITTTCRRRPPKSWHGNICRPDPLRCPPCLCSRVAAARCQEDRFIEASLGETSSGHAGIS
jgi:hypothetical protein